MTSRAPAAPVLVTGGRGRLGRLLVAGLRADGVRVVSLGRSTGESSDDVRIDLRDPDGVARVVDDVRPGTIVHLASVLRGEDLVAQNALIDEAIATASRGAAVPHVVNLSSAAVYGTQHPTARREGDELAGTSAYAQSKIHGEERFRALAVDGPTQVTTLRLFNVAGPAFPDSLVMKLLTATPEAPVALTEPDRFVRDYIHQSDAIAMIRSAMSTPVGGSHVLNLGSGVAVSTRMLLERLGITADRFVEAPGEPSWSWADVARAAEILGTRATASPDPRWGDPFLGDTPHGG